MGDVVPNLTIQFFVTAQVTSTDVFDVVSVDVHSLYLLGKVSQKFEKLVFTIDYYFYIFVPAFTA